MYEKLYGLAEGKVISLEPQTDKSFRKIVEFDLAGV